MRRPMTDRKPVRLCLILLGLALSGGLMALTAQPRSMWIDELVSVRVARLPDIAQVLVGVAQLERRPPLYHLLLHGWIGLTGESDLALRAFSILVALLALVLTYFVARELAGERLAVTSLYLVGLSPFFILYAPMVRYYSLTMALGLLSMWFFLRLQQRPSGANWAGYGLSTALLVYTDYAALSLLLVQNILVWIWPVYRSLLRREKAPAHRFPVPLWPWLVSQAVMACLLASWSLAIAMQVERGRLDADLSTSALGYLIKLVYPVYSFSLGETLFPWTAPAIIGLALGLFLWGSGIAWWRRQPGGPLVALCLLVPLGFTIFVLSTVATDITFLNVPSRTFFALPYFAMVLAGGLWRVSRPALRGLLALGLVVVWGYGLANIYGGVEYHNPIYAVPMRQVASQVRAEARPGDVIFSDVDTGFDYYYRQAPQPAPSLPAGDAAAAVAYLNEHRPQRVWLLTFGRDRTREITPVELVERLAAGYSAASVQGYVEQDPTYRTIKQRLFGRPAYPYKLVVQQYEASQP